MSGYVTLFFAGLVAATLVPIPSEGVLAALVVGGEHDLMALWAVATLGNTLGAVVNWLLARFCLRWQDRRWFPISQDRLERAGRTFERWGSWTLLLAWVPVIGDPLTFAAGLLRVRFWLFALLVVVGKGARYWVVLFVTESLVG